MKKALFFPGLYSRNIDLSLLILRLVSGGFMLTHGYGKLLKLFSSEPIKFADPIGLGMETSLVLTVFAEVICAVAVMIGLMTRWAAIPLFITMIVAAIIVHAQDGFGKQEMALLYAAMYLVIIISRAGAYSLDKMIYSRKK